MLPLAEADASAIKGFQCGKPHLDQFLTDAAFDFQVDRLANTWLVFHEDQPALVAYFTLSNDSVQLLAPEQYDLGLRGTDVPRSFPAVKIGRLAVDAALQGQGVGSAVMRLAVGKIVEGVMASAARMVVVDADNDPVVLTYYQRQGFVESQWAQKEHRNHGGKGARHTIKMLRDLLQPLT